MPSEVKNRKRFWVVKARWVDNPCMTCVENIQSVCEKERIEIPELPLLGNSYMFYSPYGFLDALCPHETSSHQGKPVVKSIYQEKSCNGKTLGQT